MYILKILLLIGVFCTSTCIGIIISKRFSNRVDILKEMKNALNMFEVKINFACEALPNVFSEIADKTKGPVKRIFKDTTLHMDKMIAGEAWNVAVENNQECLKKEDIDTLKTLGKMLGKTDIEGQISQIKLVEEFLDEQINEATDEKNKNAKMYQKLGAIVGLIMVIVLI